MTWVLWKVFELITHIPLEIRDNEEKMRSYLRGAFLAGGIC